MPPAASPRKTRKLSGNVAQQQIQNAEDGQLPDSLVNTSKNRKASAQKKGKKGKKGKGKATDASPIDSSVGKGDSVNVLSNQGVVHRVNDDSTATGKADGPPPCMLRLPAARNTQTSSLPDVEPDMTMEALKRELAEYRSRLAKAEQSLEARNSSEDKDELVEGVMRKIPRPEGEAGCKSRGFRLLKGMEIGLPGAPTFKQYKTVQRNMHTFAARFNLQCELDFRQQDAEKLAKVYAAIRLDFPYMQCYLNNWGSRAMLQMFLKNKRSHAVRKGYIPSRSQPRNQSTKPGAHKAKLQTTAVLRATLRNVDDDDDDEDDEDEDEDDNDNGSNGWEAGDDRGEGSSAQSVARFRY